MAVLASVETAHGELVLRADGEHLEVISNGVFLMDTRDGASERLLVRAALDRHPDPRVVVIGGLGVGFSLVQALSDPRVERVTVVEREQTIVDWHSSWLAPWSAGAVEDPRTTVVVADLVDWLAASAAHAGTLDVACLDTDNGPDWLVTESNAALYATDGLRQLHELLAPAGVAAFWSANASPAFAVRLADVFGAVETVTVPSASAPRGELDVVYVATRG